jgi:hypothetical protein
MFPSTLFSIMEIDLMSPWTLELASDALPTPVEWLWTNDSNHGTLMLCDGDGRFRQRWPPAAKRWCTCGDSRGTRSAINRRMAPPDGRHLCGHSRRRYSRSDVKASQARVADGAAANLKPLGASGRMVVVRLKRGRAGRRFVSQAAGISFAAAVVKFAAENEFPI